MESQYKGVQVSKGEQTQSKRTRIQMHIPHKTNLRTWHKLTRHNSQKNLPVTIMMSKPPPNSRQELKYYNYGCIKSDEFQEVNFKQEPWKTSLGVANKSAPLVTRCPGCYVQIFAAIHSSLLNYFSFVIQYFIAFLQLLFSSLMYIVWICLLGTM